MFDGGFAYSHYFTDTADKFQDINDDPETFKVLQESKMHKMRPWWNRKGKATSKKNEDEKNGNMGEDKETDEEDYDPAEVFDYGGEYEVEW